MNVIDAVVFRWEWTKILTRRARECDAGELRRGTRLSKQSHWMTVYILKHIDVTPHSQISATISKNAFEYSLILDIARRDSNYAARSFHLVTQGSYPVLVGREI